MTPRLGACQGSFQTKDDGKKFRSLYGRWQTAQPAAVHLIREVHYRKPYPYEVGVERVGASVAALQLSQVGALTAWSLGRRDTLVATDVTTCRIRNSTTFAAWFIKPDP